MYYVYITYVLWEFIVIYDSLGVSVPKKKKQTTNHGRLYVSHNNVIPSVEDSPVHSRDWGGAGETKSLKNKTRTKINV